MDPKELWVSVSQSRRLRRLAGSWTATYTAKILPEKAVAMTIGLYKMVQDMAPLQKAMLDELVFLGLSRSELMKSFVVLGVVVSAFATLTGPMVPDPCGENICKPYLRVMSTVPRPVCEQAMNCSEALRFCCEEGDAPVKLADYGNGKSLAAGFSLVAILGIVVGIGLGVAVWVVCMHGSAHWPSFHPKHSGGIVVEIEDNELEEDGVDLASVLDLPRMPPSSEPIANVDEHVVNQVLNDLRGEWRLYDGGRLLEGIIAIRDAGYTLYDGSHFEDQDLTADAEGILRSDGWYVDMQRSDVDLLEWWRDGEAGITWKRLKALSGFSMGDTVQWVQPEGEVPEKALGQVSGFTDTRLKVTFTGKVVEALPTDIDLVQRKLGTKDRSRGLPSLALCAEFKRMGHYVQEMSREHTALSSYNAELRRDYTTSSRSLSRENSQLKTQLEAVEDNRRALTNELAAEAQGLALRKPALALEYSEGSSASSNRLAELNARLENQLRRLPGSPAAAAAEAAARRNEFRAASVASPASPASPHRGSAAPASAGEVVPYYWGNASATPPGSEPGDEGRAGAEEGAETDDEYVAI